MSERIGERIRRLRLAAGLSQRQLAKLAGVSQSLIAKIELGLVNPRVETVKRILDALEKALGGLKAIDVATRPVICVSLSNTLEEAARLMDRYGISQVPVVDDRGRVVGTLYEATILRAILNHGARVLSDPVTRFMEPPLPQVAPDEDIDSVMRLLEENQAVLVVKDGRPVGIITRIDVVRRLALFTPRTGR